MDFKHPKFGWFPLQHSYMATSMGHFPRLALGFVAVMCKDRRVSYPKRRWENPWENPLPSWRIEKRCVPIWRMTFKDYMMLGDTSDTYSKKLRHPKDPPSRRGIRRSSRCCRNASTKRWRSNSSVSILCTRQAGPRPQDDSWEAFPGPGLHLKTSHVRVHWNVLCTDLSKCLLKRKVEVLWGLSWRWKWWKHIYPMSIQQDCAMFWKFWERRGPPRTGTIRKCSHHMTTTHWSFMMMVSLVVCWKSPCKPDIMWIKR